MTSSEDARYRAPALDKGLDILELLAGTDDGLSQSEIAKALNRSPNEIYRMLDRLVRRDYALRTAGDRYELTLKLFELAHSQPPIQRLVSQAMPMMRRFARESRQACHLVVHDRNVLVVVAQVDSPGYWNVSIRVGSRISIVNTGSGHVFLAYAGEEERRIMLDERDAANVAVKAPEGLPARLGKIRAQGYEIMESMQVASVINLSVPILGPVGSVLAVLTCPYVERLDRKDAPDRDEVLAALLATGQEIASHRTTEEETP